MVNSPLVRPAIYWGGTLDSREISEFSLPTSFSSGTWPHFRCFGAPLPTPPDFLEVIFIHLTLDLAGFRVCHRLVTGMCGAELLDASIIEGSKSPDNLHKKHHPPKNSTAFSLENFRAVFSKKHLLFFWGC